MTAERPRRREGLLVPYDAPEGYDGVVSSAPPEVRGSSVRFPARTVRGDAAEVVFEPLAPDVWRMALVPAGSPVPAPTPMIDAAFEPIPGLEVSSDARTARARVSEGHSGTAVAKGHAARTALALDVDLSPWELRFLDETGRTLLAENRGDVDGLGRPFVLPLGFVRDSGGGASKTAVSFRLAPDERLFGLGEKFTRLDKVGRTIESWTRDALGSTGERSHKNVPFLWSSRGFGVLVDTGGRVVWELGSRSTQSWTAIVDGPALSAYIIRGRRPADILGRYAALTGRPAVPPKWSFGLWLSSSGDRRDRAAVERLAAEADRRRVPFDVVHIDTWWLTRRKYCDFRPDPETFPRFEEMVRRFHARGLKVTLWEHPYLSVESGLFAEARDRGFLLKRPDGSVYVIDYGLSLAPCPDGVVRTAGPGESWNAPVGIIDLTHPGAVAWFQDLHRPLLRLGVDAFKTDFGEDVPEDAVFHDGRTGRDLHNLYPLLYNRAVFEVVEQEKGRGLVWSRSGTAGSQRYPVAWSGDPAADFDSLAATLRGGLSLGMSGVPFWSHDIGGYRGRPDPELYVRWAQFGLFSSHSRMHGDGPREPWAFGEKALRIVRAFIRLRSALFPYVYSTALEAGRTGRPVLRALPLEFPDDPNAAAEDLEYMFGPSLLVAPVFERIGPGRRDGKAAADAEEGLGIVNLGRGPGAPRTVYFPPGSWFELRSGRRFDGPSHVRFSAPLDRLPVFVRAGAILPMMVPRPRIPEVPPDPLILRAFPGAESRLTLLEDEGESRFTLEAIRGGWLFEWSGPVRRALRLRLPGPNARVVRAPRSTAGRLRIDR